MMHSVKTILATSLLGVFAVSFIPGNDAFADDLSDIMTTDDDFRSGVMLSSDELDDTRGTFDAVATNYLLATSSGNTANNTYSGGNTISESAFTDANGVINVIQNSGNNVLIQSATTVTVSVNQ